MAEITEWVKKVWKNRITEFPTRRTLTKEGGSSEIVTVTRNEGTVSEEGDAFDADTMNNLEERIDAGFAEVTRKLSGIKTSEILWENPAPNSNFSAQNIVLSSDHYDYLKVFFRQHNVGDGGCDAQDILKGKGAQLVYATYGGGSPIICVRKINYVDDVTLSVTAESSSGSVNQGYIVPIKIIGCYL